ncbi:MAG TPA: 50S ribosomal protein L29 [Thermomicrobiales bacterium]|nr:50S ribosomal protein L29 [Thermomicrobiales bacterium]
MKPADIRAMNEQQLSERLGELRREWRELRFQEAVGQLTATARIRQIRKDIARILTIRTEREMDAAARAFLNEQQAAAQ